MMVVEYLKTKVEIYSTNFAIYIETDLTLWNWNGTTLVNKINL